MPDYSIENEIINGSCKTVCGVDEAGRGPLCGPVCAAAVILPLGCEIEGLNDSKKLSEKKREALFDVIIDKAICYSIQCADNEEIDRVNILNATMECMTRAVNGLSVRPDYVIIDGNKCPEQLDIPSRSVVKGDAKSMSIAAASILAKVSRDRLMYEYDKQYPEYGFAKHKGYGTKAHYDAIFANGISPIHRKSFLKNLNEHKSRAVQKESETAARI